MLIRCLKTLFLLVSFAILFSQSAAPIENALNDFIYYPQNKEQNDDGNCKSSYILNDNWQPWRVNVVIAVVNNVAVACSVQ